MTAIFFGPIGLPIRQRLVWTRVRSLCNEAASGMRVPVPPLTGGATSPGMCRFALSRSERVPARARFRVCGTERPAQ